MASTFENGYALLVAVNESAVPHAALPDVAKDVQALGRVLVDPDRCGYQPANVKLLTGKDASRDGIQAGLAWLSDKLASDKSGNATALIYYTGHGHVEGGSYFLVPYDLKDGQLMKMSLLRAQDFADVVSALQPKRLLVLLDCCHAAGMSVKDLPALERAAAPVSLFKSAQPAVTSQQGDKGLETLAQGAGRAVLSSSQSSEQSWIRKDRTMSIFTYHLIEALTGHAQPPEGAKEVLVSDVMSHVWRHVPESTRADWNAEQHPDYTVSGNFAVAQLLGGKGLAKGVLPPDPLEAAKPERASDGMHIDARESKGMILGASGPITQHFGNSVDTGGGAYVGGNVRVGAGGRFIGRDSFESNTTTNQTLQIEQVFAPIMQAAQAAPPDKRAEAVAAATELKAAVTNGGQRDDSHVATLIDKLVALAPGAVSAVASAFGTPILSAIAGPVTRFVLDKLQTR